MKQTDTANQIRAWIASIMETVEMKRDLIEQNNGVNMTYDFIKDFVGVDLERIQEAWKEIDSTIPFESYVRIMALHELGHAKDREALLDSLPRTFEIYKMKKRRPRAEQYSNADLLSMRIEEHEMNIAFEKTAWQHAEEMNLQYGIAEHADFVQIKAHSLSSYIQTYEKELKIYNELLAAEIVQTA